MRGCMGARFRACAQSRDRAGARATGRAHNHGVADRASLAAGERDHQYHPAGRTAKQARWRATTVARRRPELRLWMLASPGAQAAWLAMFVGQFDSWPQCHRRRVPIHGTSRPVYGGEGVHRRSVCCAADHRVCSASTPGRRGLSR